MIQNTLINLKANRKVEIIVLLDNSGHLLIFKSIRKA